jgi:regulatory protein
MDEPPSPALITGIRSVAHGRRRLIELSDGREYLFSDEACTRAGVTEGVEITDALLQQLESFELRVNVHEAALRLLSHRPRSQTEMRTRIAMRGFDPAAIDDEIERLRNAGLLDDEKFARAWVEDRKRLAPRGRRMLKYELLGRGIDPDSADQATRDIDDQELAMELARARARKVPHTTYEAFVAKVGGFLRRRGFDFDVTAAATRQAWLEAQEGTAAGVATPDPGEN